MTPAQARVPLRVILGVATALSFFSAFAAFYFVSTFTDKPAAFGLLLTLNLGYWYSWALLAPAILWLTGRFPFDRAAWKVAIPIHIAGVFLVTSTHVVLTVALRMVTYWAIGESLDTWLHEAQEMLFLNFDWEMMTYCSVYRTPGRDSTISTGRCTGLNSGSPPRAACWSASPFPWRSCRSKWTERARPSPSSRSEDGVTKIRTVVVDDEPVARERIVGLLSQEKDIEVVGEYADGTQAVSAIQQQHPDLVFLDVQMPACDGFGVIQQLGPEKVPAVVFVTAYDEYALKAFEVHAIDYLLKPFGRDRFAQTLQHAREHLERRRAGDLGKRLMALVQDIKPEPQKLDRLVVKSGGRVFFLRTAEIDWIEAAGNYVRLHLGDDSHLFRETMNNMEGRLDAHRFVRIHRSRIVNTDRIKEMQPWFNGEYVVVLQNGTRLTLSRGYREKLQERLGKGF